MSLKQYVTQLGVAVLLLGGLCGCATHLATVKTKPARLPADFGTGEQLEPAKRYLAAADHEQPLPSLGHDLLSAQISRSVLERRPDDESARKLYNFAVARAVQDIERANLQPWRHPTSVVTGNGNYLLTTPRPVDVEHDPSRYDLLPTDTLQISGRFFKARTATGGIGAPLVAVGRTEDPQFRQHYKLRRIYAPVTAVIKFDGRRAELDFVDPFRTEHTRLGNHTLPLAVDLSASTAMLLVQERPERLGLSRVMNPEAYADTARLCQLQQFDRARTPVVFVHGLQATAASWAPMIDSLRQDPWIRAHYQFWFFSYPSGYPYPYSAMLLRRDLDGIKREFPGQKRIIPIGHSMGGMISRLMITDARDTIWRDFFGTPPARTPLDRKSTRLNSS